MAEDRARPVLSTCRDDHIVYTRGGGVNIWQVCYALRGGMYERVRCHSL